MPKSKKSIQNKDLHKADNLSRRSALGGIGAAGVLAIVGGADDAHAQNVHANRRKVKRYMEQKAAREATEPPKSWLDSILPQSAQQNPAVVAAPSSPLLAAARMCLDQGNQARTYCLERLAAGDKSVEPCLQAIQAMIPVCSALGKLDELKAARLKVMAKTAMVFLADCQRECQKLSQVHIQLSGCALACGSCVQECKNTLRA